MKIQAIDGKPLSAGGKLLKANAGGGTAIDLGVTGAAVGDIIKVAAVDADGKPTAWEAAELVSGDGDTWENLPLLRTDIIEEAVKGIELSNLDIQHRAMIVVEMPKTATTATYAGVNVYINGKVANDRYFAFNSYAIFTSINSRFLCICLERVANGSYIVYGYSGQKGGPYNTSQGMVSCGGSSIPPYYAGETVPQSIYLESQKDDVVFPAGTKVYIYRGSNV